MIFGTHLVLWFTFIQIRPFRVFRQRRHFDFGGHRHFFPAGMILGPTVAVREFVPQNEGHGRSEILNDRLEDHDDVALRIGHDRTTGQFQIGLLARGKLGASDCPA